MGASLLALANEIYMLLKDANILPLQFSYYESIAKLMLDIENKTAAANIPELFEEISRVVVEYGYFLELRHYYYLLYYNFLFFFLLVFIYLTRMLPRG